MAMANGGETGVDRKCERQAARDTPPPAPVPLYDAHHPATGNGHREDRGWSAASSGAQPPLSVTATVSSRRGCAPRGRCLLVRTICAVSVGGRRPNRSARRESGGVAARRGTQDRLGHEWYPGPGSQSAGERRWPRPARHRSSSWRSSRPPGTQYQESDSSPSSRHPSRLIACDPKNGVGAVRHARRSRWERRH